MTAIGKVLRGTVGIVMLAVFVWLAVRFLKADNLQQGFGHLLKSPFVVMGMTASYALSFVLKAAAWRLYANAEQPLRKHLAPLGYSLLVNHLLPVKAGDLVRTGLAAKLEGRSWDESFHTVAVLRLMDISVLLLFGAAGIAGLGIAWYPDSAWWLAGTAVLGISAVFAGLQHARRRGSRLASRHLELLKRLRSRQAAGAWLITAASWVLEAAVPLGVLIALQTPIPSLQAVWVNSMTVAGQLFHIAPGGIGTYETTMSASLAALGIGGSSAFTAAVVSHAYKFLFSFAAGLFSWIVLPVRMEEGVRWLSRRRIGKVEHAE